MCGRGLVDIPHVDGNYSGNPSVLHVLTNCLCVMVERLLGCGCGELELPYWISGTKSPCIVNQSQSCPLKVL